jgi:hypothetical protein
MTEVINALIIPLESSAPDQTLPGGRPPSGATLPAGDLPRPSNPIYFPLPPGAPVDPSYGSPIFNRPDQSLPGSQPQPDQGLPPGTPPRPGQGLPGAQPQPDQGLPGSQPGASHPIALPPGSGVWKPFFLLRPDQTLPGAPGIDNTLPPPTEEEVAKADWKVMWTPTTGWVRFAIVVQPPQATPKQ